MPNALRGLIPRLQLITNRWAPGYQRLLSDREFLDVIDSAIRGGVDCVQYWHHQDENAPVVARQVQEVCRSRALFIVNDYVELAREIGADGVWLGQDDMDPVRARETLGENAFLGLTCDTIANLREANDLPEGVLSAVSAVINPSLLNPAANALGMDGFQQICEESRYPVIAIGGLTTEVVEQMQGINFAGIAVSGQVTHAEPESEAMKFANAMTY